MYKRYQANIASFLPSLPPSLPSPLTYPKMPACLPIKKTTFSVTHSCTNHVTKGVIRIAAKELIYTDNESHGDWVWPLIHIKTYGYDGIKFIIETGRQYPRGEGIYTFFTEEAEQLFQMVNDNINVIQRTTLPLM